MWRSAAVVAWSIFAGCTGTDSASETIDPGDESPPEDTDTTNGACVEVAEGPWTMNGSCFMHEMSATLTTTGDGCAFQLSDWSMAMSVPDGGTVSDDEVTLTGDDWDYCSGTTDGESISGGCTTGCLLEMEYDG